MPRAVMALSSRYPQLLCILMRFFPETSLVTSVRIARIMLNDVPTSTTFINSKPRFRLTGGKSESVKRRGCTLSRKTTGIVVGGRLEAEVLSGR
jgi:hypothetical protein